MSIMKNSIKQFKNFKSSKEKNSLNENNPCKTKATNDFFIDSIIDAIEKVNPNDWEHFFNDKAILDIIPFNPISKTAYNGFNKIFLMIWMMVRGYNSNKFATFKQISVLGGKVKKGAKSLPVEYFNFLIKHKETQKIISVQDYEKLPQTEKSNYRKSSFIKIYRVFNLDEVEGINVEKFETFLADFNPIEDIDDFLNDTINSHSINIEFKRTDKAFYSPARDLVTLPLKQFFTSADSFYSTAFHELTHWTGSAQRLDREKGEKFGDEKYAFEELVAELGSMLVLNEYNLFSQFGNSLRYLKSWLQATQGNTIEELRTAFVKSKQAVRYLNKR